MPTTFSLDEAVEDSQAATAPPQTFGLDEAVAEPEPKTFGLDDALTPAPPKIAPVEEETPAPGSPLNLDNPPQATIPEPEEIPSLDNLSDFSKELAKPQPTKIQQAQKGLSDFSQETAKVAASIADDIVAGKGEFSGNIPAMISGEPLPYEKTVQDITKSNPKTAIVAQAAQNVIGTAPQLLIPGPALPKLAQRIVAGVFTYFIFKNAKDTADALGDEYGKSPEDRDPNKVRDLWANAIEDTGFAALTGYGVVQPGIAKEIPSLQKYLTKSLVESYPPDQLFDVFDRVTTGQDTPEDRSLYDLIIKNIPNRSEAIKKGVIVTTEGVPKLDYDALSKYLGIKEPLRTAAIAGEQPPGIPLTPESAAAGEQSISQPVKQLTTGEDYASGKPSTTGVSQREVRPQVGEETPLRQQGEVAGTRPPTEVAPSPSQAPPGPQVGVAPIPPEAIPVLRSKLFENMQGREMFIAPENFNIPDAHLKLVFGNNAPSWKQLSDAGIITATPKDGGLVSVKVNTQATGVPEEIKLISQPEVEAKPAPVATPTAAAKPPELMTPEEHAAVYPIVKSDAVIDGRTILNPDRVPNTDSIESSITNPKVLPGIREVPMSDFTLTGKHYSVEGQKKIDSLAKSINQSGKIAPLIVVRDHKGAYILEGATRVEALFKLGAKSFPAKVVLDMGDIESKQAKPPAPAQAETPAGMSLNPTEHGFDSVEQFESDFEKLSIKEDADTFAETKDEFLKRKHCQSLAQTPIQRAKREKP